MSDTPSPAERTGHDTPPDDRRVLTPGERDEIVRLAVDYADAELAIERAAGRGWLDLTSEDRQAYRNDARNAYKALHNRVDALTRETRTLDDLREDAGLPRRDGPRAGSPVETVASAKWFGRSHTHAEGVNPDLCILCPTSPEEVGR